MAKSDSKQTCFGCVEIRKGVLIMMFVNLLLSIATLAIAGTKYTANKKAEHAPGRRTAAAQEELRMAVKGSLITLGVSGAAFLWQVGGFYSAYARRLGFYRVFVYVMIAFFVAQVAVHALAKNWASLAFDIISGYFIYVYYSYIDTMREELGESTYGSHA